MFIPASREPNGRDGMAYGPTAAEVDAWMLGGAGDKINKLLNDYVGIDGKLQNVLCSGSGS
jgi:hypothetical protein